MKKKLSIADYKGIKLSADLVSLYFARLLIQTAFGVVGIFLPIFFFVKYNESIHKVILVFIVLYAVSILLAPISARPIATLGMKKMMIMAVPFAMLSIAALFFWDMSPLASVFFYLLFIIIYKTFYWVPYHVDFAKFTDGKVRGRQMSFLRSISQIISTITPIVGGAAIAYFGFNGMFALSVAIFLFAIIPLLFVRETYETFTFGYFETFKKLFARENRSLLIAYTGDGMQSIVYAIVWPIFIFMLLKGEYIKVGAITSITVLAIILLRFVIGDMIDKWSLRKTTVIGSIVYTTGWVIKVFVETAFQIFLVDTYHNIGRVVNRMSFDASTYDQAADSGHYVDEFTVLKEIALNMGKILMLATASLLIFFFSIKVAFIAAAISTLLMVMINKRVHVQ